MGVLQVFDLQEKVIGKSGAASACPYCAGPVLAWDIDAHLVFFCCIPISHKTKRKLYCTICSRRLVPVS